MAEAILNSKGEGKIMAYSAGNEPAEKVNPYAIAVMKEIGIDISNSKPKSASLFTDEYFDVVITLCDRAKNQCPLYSSSTIHIHWGFPDPEYFEGSDEEILRQFRTICLELYRRIGLLITISTKSVDKEHLTQKLNEILENDQSMK